MDALTLIIKGLLPLRKEYHANDFGVIKDVPCIYDNFGVKICAIEIRNNVWAYSLSIHTGYMGMGFGCSEREYGHRLHARSEKEALATCIKEAYTFLGKAASEEHCFSKKGILKSLIGIEKEYYALCC
jgi:hypothetical protein